MSDHAYVTLSVPKELANQAEALFAGDEPDTTSEEDGLATFGFTEVNYGGLNFLKELQKHGIAYSSSWENGGNFTAGTESCRFTPEGGMNLREIYDEQLSIPIDDLMKLIESPTQLKQWIVNAHESITILPWDNQVEYGKRHRLQLLLSS